MSSSEQQQQQQMSHKKSVHKLNPRLREKVKKKCKAEEPLTTEEKKRRQEQKKRRVSVLAREQQANGGQPGGVSRERSPCLLLLGAPSLACKKHHLSPQHNQPHSRSNRHSPETSAPPLCCSLTAAAAGARAQAAC
jgi:hypothetical protein